VRTAGTHVAGLAAGVPYGLKQIRFKIAEFGLSILDTRGNVATTRLRSSSARLRRAALRPQTGMANRA
jgi:hypothetical protein